MVKFVYCLQSSAENATKFWSLQKDNSDLYVLTYDRPLPDNTPVAKTIFAPKSTWAEGRNRLTEEALRASANYEYFIFLDDDVSFIRGSFTEFERLIAKYRPKFAMPVMPVCRVYGFVSCEEAQPVRVMDEQINALHRSVLEDRHAMPLVTEFDRLSWFIACNIYQYRMLQRYWRDALQFNELEVLNEGHSVSNAGQVKPGSSYNHNKSVDVEMCAKDYIRKCDGKHISCVTHTSGNIYYKFRRKLVNVAALYKGRAFNRMTARVAAAAFYGIAHCIPILHAFVMTKWRYR